MKKTLLAAVSTISVLGFAGVAFALPYFSQTQSMVPGQNDTYNLGTTSPSTLEYLNLFVKNITVSGTCTGCGGAGSGITAIGNYATTTGTTLSFSTTTASAVSGLTANVQIVPSANGILFIPSLTGSISGLTTGNFSSANISQWTNNSNYVTLGSLSATWPIIDTSGTFSFGGLGTSTNLTQGQLPYVTGVNTFGQVATTTLSQGGPITITNGPATVIGGSAMTLGCTTCVLTSRNVNTTYPLQGGGALSGDLTLTTAFGTTSSTGLAANQFVYTSNTGVLIAAASSTLSLPNTALQNSSVTVNTNAPLGGGGAVSLGGSALTLTCTTCATFAYPFTPSTFGINVSATSTPILDYPGLIAATSTIGALTASSSITNQGVKSALVLDSATGLEGAYSPPSNCSNQASQGISATGASFNCASINNAWWSGTQLTVGNGGTGLTAVGDGNLLMGGVGGGTANLVGLATSTGGVLSESYTTGQPQWIATSTLNIVAATGGSNGQFIFNNSGVQAGVSPSTFHNTGGWLSFGTSTLNISPSPGILVLGTSTAPQIVLTDNSQGTADWFLRAMNGWLYFGTSSPSTFATSTAQPPLTITSGGELGSCITVLATSTSMVLDWTGTCPEVDIKISTAATTITIINATTSAMAGSRKLVNVQNPSTGTAGAVTWNGSSWYGRALPAQTTAAGQGDSWSFHVMTSTSTVVTPYTYIVEGAQSTGF